jgi:hypothetical protein
MRAPEYRTQWHHLNLSPSTENGKYWGRLDTRRFFVHLDSRSPWKVRQLIADRRIPFVQDGDGPFLLDVRDLDGFIERSKRVV